MMDGGLRARHRTHLSVNLEKYAIQITKRRRRRAMAFGRFEQLFPLLKLCIDNLNFTSIFSFFILLVEIVVMEVNTLLFIAVKRAS